jgi:hypothetical protein
MAQHAARRGERRSHPAPEVVVEHGRDCEHAVVHRDPATAVEAVADRADAQPEFSELRQ